MSELCFTPATELAARIAARELSPAELMDAVLDRIEALQPRLNAFCLVRAEEARREAAEAERARGDLGPLHGIPVSIKDLTSTKGIRTTFGSRAYADHVPDVDAVFVTRLREAGAILLGKTNTPEFGNKGVTESPLNGTTANPWALDHTAGGSSGGAAAAVAAGLGPLAEGSDGAGSIRIPASCCGVVGYKPSFGRVPMYPRNGYHTISHHGPLTRTVADAALMLSVMAGPDPRDPHIRTDTPADYRRRGPRAGHHGLDDRLHARSRPPAGRAGDPRRGHDGGAHVRGPRRGRRGRPGAARRARADDRHLARRVRGDRA